MWPEVIDASAILFDSVSNRTRLETMSSILPESPILIIDDSQIMRHSLKIFLAQEGFTSVEEASNGVIALEKIEEFKKRNNPFRLILLDWAMPQMDGLTFLKKCREDHAMDDTAIIMVTAISDQARTIAAFENGVTAYLTKPFRQEDISKTMKQVMVWAEKNADK